MKLNELMEQIEYKCLFGTEEAEISSVVYDSRKVEKGSLFVCMKGFQTDGHQYIPKAVELGASAILVQDDVDPSVVGENVTVLQVADTRAALALVAAKWFDYPAKKNDHDWVNRNKRKNHNCPYDEKDFGGSR